MEGVGKLKGRRDGEFWAGKWKFGLDLCFGFEFFEVAPLVGRFLRC